jgi:hypothetical protein
MRPETQHNSNAQKGEDGDDEEKKNFNSLAIMADTEFAITSCTFSTALQFLCKKGDATRKKFFLYISSL